MTTYDLLIKNGKIVTAESITQGDIAIKDGKIIEVGQSLQGSARARNRCRRTSYFAWINRYACPL